jgi:hypothetical protein
MCDCNEAKKAFMEANRNGVEITKIAIICLYCNTVWNCSGNKIGEW